MRTEEFSNKLRTDISECVHDELKFESLTLRGSDILSSPRSESVYILELSSSWIISAPQQVEKGEHTENTECSVYAEHEDLKES